MPSAPHFRVSTGLKSLIGRELITDDFIAVFELVKNSFDAHAKRVDITFANLGTPRATLTIQDDGKGMDRRDLLEKWLFVAYSAKKHGKEDYRDNIRSKRIFAGAKGIGRFSCDKLGGHLDLFSRKAERAAIQHLKVNWDRFEEDAEEEFVEIPISLTYRRKPVRDLGRGTVLRITKLREPWDRQKLLKLRSSLEKLINPNQGNDADAFAVHLHAADQLAADKKVEDHEPWKRVNGRIENFLFEDLKIRTTYIRVKVPEDGATVSTYLEDRGTFIYKTTERNPYPLLRNVNIHLFALNTAAKGFFTKRMGVPAVQFGSVFLFKNGFRVYPIGEEADDSWHIDRRKQQGSFRFLGTRDLVGRVEINGENPEFQEATSRDGGLIQTAAVSELQRLFLEFTLRRLERFAVDVIKYGNEDPVIDGEFRSKALGMVLGIAKSKALLEFNYNPDIVDVLKEASEKSLRSIVKQFRRLAESSDNPQLEREAQRAEKRMGELANARREAEEEAFAAATDRRRAEEKAEAERERAKRAEVEAKAARREARQHESQSLFLRDLVSADTENLVGLHHHIGIAAGTIQNHVQSMARRIRTGKPLSSEMFLATLEKISHQANAIASSARLGTRASFPFDSARMDGDVVAFAREYILNVCDGLILTNKRQPMKFEWEEVAGIELTRSFRPLDVVVLLDNLVSNSRKAGAKKVLFSVGELPEGGALVSISDDGKGVPSSGAKKIFQLGYTTTNGSGFGLFHAAKIAADLGGQLRLGELRSKGSEFLWEIPK